MLVWVACDRSRAGLLLAIGTAIVGCFVEVALTSLDAFHYVHPDAGPIASWLPWIYVTASVAVGNLGRFLSDNAPIEAASIEAAPIGPRVSDPPGRSSMPRAGGDT